MRLGLIPICAILLQLVCVRVGAVFASGLPSQNGLAADAWATVHSTSDWIDYVPNTILQNPDNSLVVGGDILYYQELGDMWLAKFSSKGGIAWLKSYVSPGRADANSVALTADGGYVLAGSTTYFGLGDEDALVIRVDLNGNVLWQRTYGGGQSDVASSVLVLPDGGYLVGGYTESLPEGVPGEMPWLIRVDAYGNVQWQRAYGFWGSDFSNYDHGGFDSLAAVGDGRYYAAGHYAHEWVICIQVDSAGNPCWATGVRGPYYYPEACAVARASDSAAIVGGVNDDSDGWCMKVDVSGNVLWHKTWRHSEFYSVVGARDGGFVVGGQVFSDGLFLKMDANGNPLWLYSLGNEVVGTYEGFDMKDVRSVTETADGGYALTGDWSSFWSDAGVIRTNSAGLICGNIAHPFSTTVFDTAVEVAHPTPDVTTPSIVPTAPGMAAKIVVPTFEIVCSSAGGPTITSVTSSTSKPGKPATIRGSGFSATKAQNTVKFGKYSATVNNARAMRITVTIPTRCKSGSTYGVQVTVGGQKSNRVQFKAK